MRGIRLGSGQRRSAVWGGAGALVLAWVSLCAMVVPGRAAEKVPEKIIIDTDIGSDIDDAFAVALALNSPEFTVLGFTTASGDTTERAKIIDRMLGEAHRGEIPVAVGAATALPHDMPPIGRQQRYGDAGPFIRKSHPDAVEFIRSQILRFPGQITLVTIGPLTNAGALIDQDVKAFRKLKRVVMMGGDIGAIRWGGGGSTREPMPEYNILGDIRAAQKVFTAGVPVYVMPLDSTVGLKLDEVKRDVLFSQGTALTDSLTQLYHFWGGTTPILFDAMTLGFLVDPQLCPVKGMRIRVDDKGVTRTEAGAPNSQVCLRSDVEGFFRFYMKRLVVHPEDLG